MPDRPASANPAIVLGIDFGFKRIGIASGDTLTRTAHPRTTIPNGPQGPDWPVLRRLIDETRPTRLAVGEPYNADGSESPLTSAARGFAAELARLTSLPVDLIDERWSSLDAEERLRTMRASGQRQRRVTKADVDAAAAAVILERWFEKH